jgi:2-octaprenyl-6-methoxyphenol hydroxylase
MAQKKFDIAVIGGGLAGLTQSLMLAQGGFSVICFDRDNPAENRPIDARTTAISYGSHLVLQKAGIWQDLLPNACPIQDIQILDGNSPVLLDFDVGEVKDDIRENAFGWIIENHFIKSALLNAIKKQKTLNHITGHAVKDFKQDNETLTVELDNNETYKTSLVIGADGRQSFTRDWMNIKTRNWSYNQQALVTIVTHENPHHNIAVEHFRAEGPFAILPMLDDKDGHHRSSIVWTDHHNQVLSYDDETFLTALNCRFPEFYGEILKSEQRFSYPLNFSHAYDYTAPRMVLIGDAAHGIHPIAGQGLNLGFRDIDCLCDLLQKARENNQDIAGAEILKKYERERKVDNIAMAAFTDLLNRVFSNPFSPMRLARKAGLSFVGKIGPAKKFFMRKAMGI